MAETSSCDGWKPFFAMITTDFVFAVVNILLKKALDEGINHLILITYRLSIAAVFLAPISYFGEKNCRPKLTVSILCYIFISAIVGASLTQYCFLLGIQNTSATFACAFLNMVPVITFVMALSFRLETVNIKSTSGRAKVLGTLVCVGGAMTLTLYKGFPLFNQQARTQTGTHAVDDDGINMRYTSGKERWSVGCVALVAGTLLWSSWFLLQSKIGRKYPCQYSSTAIMSFFGAIQSAVLSLCIGDSHTKWILNSKIQIVTVLFAGIVGSGLSYVGMSWCVKKRGPVFTSAFSPLVQIMAAIIDIPILHEELHLGSVLGSFFVIIGLYILLWGKNKEIPNHATKVTQEKEETKEQEPPLEIITVSSDL